MRKTKLFGLLLTCLAMGAIAAAPITVTVQEQEQEKQEEEKQDEDEEKKYTTKEVMKLAHKDGLLKKVAKGEASEDEKKQLVTLYKAMAKNDPPKGDKEAWDERNKALIEAAEAAVKGEEDAADMLKKASNCKSCHDEHK